jgi:hypothetical protein
MLIGWERVAAAESVVEQQQAGAGALQQPVRELRRLGPVAQVQDGGFGWLAAEGLAQAPERGAIPGGLQRMVLWDPGVDGFGEGGPRAVSWNGQRRSGWQW